MLSISRPSQTQVVATIATLPDRLDALPAEGPVLVLIGRVLESAMATEQAAEETSAATFNVA